MNNMNKYHKYLDQEKPEIKYLGLFKVKKDYIKGDIVQQFEKKIKQYYYE